MTILKAVLEADKIRCTEYMGEHSKEKETENFKGSQRHVQTSTFLDPSVTEINKMPEGTIFFLVISTFMSLVWH